MRDRSATTQQDRNAAPLGPGFIDLNELSFEQMLNWSRQFSGLVRFYDANSCAQRTWAPMFASNELVVMAHILALSLPAQEQAFLGCLSRPMDAQITFLIQFFQQVNQWYCAISTSNQAAEQLKLALINEIQTTLCPALSQLTPHLQAQRDAHPEWLTQVQQWDDIWREASAQVLPLKLALPDLVQSTFSIQMSALQHLQTVSQNLMDSALFHGDHPPQLGLYFTFLKLFESVRQRANTLPERHLHFYYQTVLKQQPESLHQDRVLLKLSLGKGAQSRLQIDKTLQFSPGKDARFQPILYQPAYAMTVTDAEVCQLLSLHLHHDNNLSPEQEFGFVTGLTGMTQTIDAKQTTAQYRHNRGMPLFGSKPHQQSAIQPLGIIISDPLFSMSQGQRTIRIEWHLHEPDHGLFQQQCHHLNDVRQHPDQVAHVLYDIFAMVLHTQRYWLSTLSLTIGVNTLVEHIDDRHLAELLQQVGNDACLSSGYLCCKYIYRCFFFTLLRHITQPQDFFQLIGQILSRHALSAHPWLSAPDLDDIEREWQRIVRAHPDPAVQMNFAIIQAWLHQSQSSLFQQLCGNVFQMAISTAQGWESFTHINAFPLNDPEKQCFGFTIGGQVDDAFAPFTPPEAKIHGTQALTDFPAIKITQQSQVDVFPYSIFREFELKSLRLFGQVKGLVPTQLWNSDGPMSPTGKFLPFGVLPTSESFFMIASQELACKSLSDIELAIRWADLPKDPGGFAGYYDAYPTPYTNDNFTAQVQLLSHGKWVLPADPTVTLFDSAGSNETLVADRTLTMHIDEAYGPKRLDWPETPYDQQAQLRNGLIKLTLCDSPGTFGHQEYGPLLSETLIHNVRKHRHPLPLPNEPYTPAIRELKLNYRARGYIAFDQDEDADNHTTVTHLHPFGQHRVYPPVTGELTALPRFFPLYQHAGQFYIGIRATALSHYLSLYFVLSDQVTQPEPNASQCFEWGYLVGNHWVILESNKIVHDSTHGFLTSGVVTLETPQDIDCHHTVLPDGIYWLRVCTNCDINHYPDCFYVATNILEVTGYFPGTNRDFYPWVSLPVLPQLGAINQLTPLIDSPDVESQEKWIARVRENLRHKGQALQPWDYERLVLQHFSAIERVRCFPHVRWGETLPAPGHLLVVILPAATDCQHQPCQQRSANASQMIAIREFLAARCADGIHVDVRSPGYEQIQIQCQLQLRPQTHHGQALRQLNYAICQYLCPWERNSINSGFEWALSIHQLTEFIRRQPNVLTVNSLSLLKIAHPDNDHYELVDTGDPNYRLFDTDKITANYPWNLLIPAPQHHIEITDSAAHLSPHSVGIGDFTIGDEFIIQTSKLLKPNDQKRSDDNDKM